jgi:protein TilB
MLKEQKEEERDISPTGPSITLTLFSSQPPSLIISQELEYLNLAINNITCIENLHRCESLRKLELTLNFIPAKALPPSMTNLRECPDLKELYMEGNPCTRWPGYRLYIIHMVSQLASLDGRKITEEERKEAELQYPLLCQQLATMNDDDERREEDNHASWSPATRLRDHTNLDDAIVSPSNQTAPCLSITTSALKQQEPTVYARLPLPEEGGPPLRQINQGRWNFSFKESSFPANNNNNKNATAITLEIALPKYLDTSFIGIDIQPRWVRLLIKGRLLQLYLPDEVSPDLCSARRKISTGALILTLPTVVVEKCRKKQGVLLDEQSGDDGVVVVGGGRKNASKGSIRKGLWCWNVEMCAITSTNDNDSDDDTIPLIE